MPPSGVDLDCGDFANVDGIDFCAVREANRAILFDLLDSLNHHDEKSGEQPLTIIWDAELMKPFALIATVSEIKAHGVVKNVRFESDSAKSVDEGRALFFVKPELHKMDLIIDNMKRVEPSPFTAQYHVVFVPRVSVACARKLQDSGMSMKLASMEDLPIYAYMWEKDVLSMENASILTKCLLHEDWANGLYEVGCFLVQLEEIMGSFAQDAVWYKGDWAKHVVQLVRSKKGQEENICGRRNNQEHNDSCMIDHLFLVDRMCDVITPFVTQLTYEGLIDELFQIDCASAKFPRDRFSDEKQQEGRENSAKSKDLSTEKQVNLSSTDELFGQLRDLHLNAVGPNLSKKIKSISEQSDQHKQSTTVHELKEFVKRLPQLQATKISASVHTTIAELIKQTTTTDFFLSTVQCEQEILNCVEMDRVHCFIESSIAKQENMWKILRLMCLHSISSGGLKPKVLHEYNNEFLQSYGYGHISLLMDLQRAGLLREKNMQPTRALHSTYAESEPPLPFPTLSKNIELIVEGVDERKPTDVSYVYSGYAPIIPRIMKKYWCTKQWRDLVETMRKLPGASGFRESLSTENASQRVNPAVSVDSGRRKNVIVFFIGGVTLAEISAFRFINSQQSDFHFSIITTHILNGDSLLKTFDGKVNAVKV